MVFVHLLSPSVWHSRAVLYLSLLVCVSYGTNAHPQRITSVCFDGATCTTATRRFDLRCRLPFPRDSRFCLLPPDFNPNRGRYSLAVNQRKIWFDSGWRLGGIHNRQVLVLLFVFTGPEFIHLFSQFLGAVAVVQTKIAPSRENTRIVSHPSKSRNAAARLLRNIEKRSKRRSLSDRRNVYAFSVLLLVSQPKLGCTTINTEQYRVSEKALCPTEFERRTPGRSAASESRRRLDGSQAENEKRTGGGRKLQLSSLHPRDIPGKLVKNRTSILSVFSITAAII
ncbi:hypothetical protein R3P38DRAFT_3101175 [Favolaschia claudopus]|uniref:Secreted protein n=1 Tax=Favolaschia claudopus TaxID=2862362 RepID=A0AAV9ZMR6_9AGAR